ncbi:hypothetical protein EV714DRAFT_203250 [Schizophyllum commune]
MSGEYRMMLLVDGSAYSPTHPAGTPHHATTHAPGRPRDASAPEDTMLSTHAGGRSKPVASMRRVRFAPTIDAETTGSDDLEVFIAEMTRRFDAEADALDSLAQSPSFPINGPASEGRLVSGGATSDSESDTDDVSHDVSDCERSGKAKVTINAPFLSLCQNDTPADCFASTPENTRVKFGAGDEKENRYPYQWMAVSSADRREPKSADLTVRCDEPRSPPRYPDWVAEIAEEREKLAAEVLAETLDKLAPRPPMNFDSEVRISQRLRVGSVLLPKSKRRKVVHVSTHEA